MKTREIMKYCLYVALACWLWIEAGHLVGYLAIRLLLLLGGPSPGGCFP